MTEDLEKLNNSPKVVLDLILTTLESVTKVAVGVSWKSKVAADIQCLV